MNINKCGGCTFNVNTDPCKCPIVPPNYPFNRPARDSYSFCCCGPSNPLNGKDPITSAYPSSGMFKGSAFAMFNGNPYLMDSTNMKYGQVLVYSENVYTQVSQRDDLSCINLAARFDMTDTSLSNTVRNDFLKQYISRKYLELSGVLPIIKTQYKVRIHYTIRDIDGGTINSTHVDTVVNDSNFHFTDIKDRYVQSLKGLVVATIPAITYQGLYNITIDRVELIVDIINTKEHLVDAMNPFYTFVNNNAEIVLHNDIIEPTEKDTSLTIAECDVMRSFDYQANITNRLRISFTAFTSLPIACGDTMGIWNALNEPTDAVISQLRNEVTALEDEVAALHQRDEELQAEIDNLNGQVTLNTNNIATLTAKVATLEAANAAKDTLLTEIIERLEALERVPLALVAYKENVEFIRSQITWRGYGELYQATKNFTASGNFMTDVTLGNLVPVAADAQDISALSTRIEEVATIATEANSTAETVSETVDDMITTVSDISDTVDTHTTSLTGLNNTMLALNEDIDDIGDELESLTDRVVLLEHPLDPTKINVRKASDNTVTTYDTMADAVAYINADTSTNSEKYDIIIGSDMTFGVDTAYQKISSSKLRDVYNNGVNRAVSQEAFKNSGIEHFYWGDMSNHTDAALEAMCFSGCANLKSFEFPSIPVSIGSGVFTNSCLTTINIPASVTSISDTAFSDSAIETINIDKAEDSIYGSPWGATNATVNWNG